MTEFDAHGYLEGLNMFEAKDAVEYLHEVRSNIELPLEHDDVTQEMKMEVESRIAKWREEYAAACAEFDRLFPGVRTWDDQIQ